MTTEIEVRPENNSKTYGTIGAVAHVGEEVAIDGVPYVVTRVVYWAETDSPRPAWAETSPPHPEDRHLIVVYVKHRRRKEDE